MSRYRVPWCSKRHAIPNGAVTPVAVKCKWCGSKNNTSFDWFCKDCSLCLDCGRPRKPKEKKGERKGQKGVLE